MPQFLAQKKQVLGLGSCLAPKMSVLVCFWYRTKAFNTFPVQQLGIFGSKQELSSHYRFRIRAFRSFPVPKKSF